MRSSLNSRVLYYKVFQLHWCLSCDSQSENTPDCLKLSEILLFLFSEQQRTIFSTLCFRLLMSQLTNKIQTTPLNLLRQKTGRLPGTCRSSPQRDRTSHFLRVQCPSLLLVTRCTNKYNIQQLYVLPTLYLCVV
jgi:hypothetical protein